MPDAALHVGKRGTRYAVAVLVAIAITRVHAADLWPDVVSGTIGYKPQVGIAGGVASWYLTSLAAPRDQTGLSIHLDGGVAYWRGYGRPTPNGSLWDFSGTPVFRWTFSQPEIPRLFAEAGIGIHLLTHTWINNDRQFGIAFQFGEDIGIGTAFGERNRYEVKLYVQHISNAHIAKENWGLTTPMVMFSMALE